MMRSTNHTIKFSPKRDSMVFRMNDFTSDNIYQKKICSYLEFLYKVNFSNNIYVDLSLSGPIKQYRVKIGRGNNRQLVSSILKRRFWFEVTNSNEDLAFIWSQDTKSIIHKSQMQSTDITYSDDKKSDLQYATSKIMTKTEYK